MRSREKRKNRALEAQQRVTDALNAAHHATGAGLGTAMSSGPLGNAPTLSGAPEGSVNEAVFNSALQKLIAASGGKISITSGKRSTERQAQLWEQALKKYGSESAARKWVAPPRGYRLSDGSIAQGSRHEMGLAADLKYADDAIRRWAHENARQYGLHFPLGNEPWHIEPIGSR